MTRRIAHRPRYRNVPPQTSRVSRKYKDRFYTHWAYRRFNLPRPQPRLGQGLLLAPVYRFAHTILIQ